jgi:large subunit ribosomal protein L10
VNREEKAKVIEQLHARAKEADIAFVTDFRGLKVENMEDLRKKLREKNVDFQVVKNTLARKAFKDSPHEPVRDNFRDCCAIAFGYDDPIVAAKVLVDFAKKNKKFELRFASYQGKYLDSESITSLSQMPSREELLSKMLMTFNAVPTNFVSLFANLIRNFLYALNGIKEQKEQSGQAQ